MSPLPPYYKRKSSRLFFSGGGQSSHNHKKFIPGHRKSKSDGGNIFFACGKPSPSGSTETLPWSAGRPEQRKHLLDDSILDESPLPSPASSNMHQHIELSGGGIEDLSSSLERGLLLSAVNFPCSKNSGSSSLGSRSGNRSDSAGSRKNSWSQLANLQQSGTHCVFQVG